MKLTTPQAKEVAAKGKAALEFIQTQVGGIKFALDSDSYTDYSVSIDSGEVVGRIEGNINKNTGFVTLKWKPIRKYASFAPRRYFKYDATDGVDDIIPFIAWVGDLRIDLDL